MTEKLPDVEAYQPPVIAPVDASEPSLYAPVDAYQPPPAGMAFHPRPSPPSRRSGKRLAVVVAAGLLLGAGVVAVSATEGPREAASVQPEALPVADPPEAAEAGDAPEAAEAAEPADPPPAVAGPPAAGGWPDLPALPGSAEDDVRSATDGDSTWIRFANDTSATVTVRWLDYDGRRVRYNVLGAGQSYDQPTFGGHAWVVTRADGTAIAVFEAAAEPARAVIR